MKNKILLIIFLLAIIFLVSCKKEPGIGGDASIRGKVYVKHYNPQFSHLLGEYYGPDIYVYIIYGNNISYGSRIKSTYEGAFEFKYLYEGDYKVYAYSKDSSAVVNGLVRPDSAVVRQVSITGRNDDADVGDIVIFQ